ncbi:Multidrug resistance 3 [Fagus crenata]|uniref:Multidrug resistance protein n=1 Tax=Fagus sylvatica TaxID=28930 RepID=A0A2N9INA5_FAGSY
MSDFGSERSKPWNIYTSSDPSSSQTGASQEAPWKSFGTSMNAISFGFVATAILISMFLIMAIFEHLFRPGPSFSSPENATNGSHESRPMKKLGKETVTASYASDFSVLMPGQQYPTYIAQPAPLPCTRERIYWPSHDHNFVLP